MTNIKDNELQADGDPRLTAYALGELDGAERAQIEALLARDAAARAEVEAIRATADALGAEFAAEAAGPAPELTAAQKSIIASAARGAGAVPVRRGAWRWMAPLAAAAVLVLWIAIDRHDELAGSVKQHDFDKLVAKGEPEPAPPDQLAQLRELGYIGGKDSRSAREQVAPALGYSGGGGGGTIVQSDAKAAAANKVAPLSDEMRQELTELGYIHDGSSSGSAAPGAGPAKSKADAAESPAARGDAASGVAKSDEFGVVSGLAGSSTTLTGKGRQVGDAKAAAEPPASQSPFYDANAMKAFVPAAAAAPAAPVDGRALQDNLVAKLDDSNRFEIALRYIKLPPSAPGTESYQPIVEQDFVSPWTTPLSTFGVDVDTASYSNVRRFLNNGQLPPADAVRLEELVNYFRYDDPQPAADAPEGCPFGVNVQIAQAPWAPSHRLVRIGLKGREVPAAARPSSNLVFLLDVSGSMDEPDKLPLLQQCLKLLTRNLDARDRVAIVVYAGAAGRVLDSTTCDGPGREKVIDALDRLRAGGSTAGAAGIQLAYDTAAQTFLKEGTNRVILCTDGDFNVGISDRDSLQHLIEGRANSGVFLTVLGFGEGNLKDGTAELLADKGNGVYAYIDSLDEGRRVLVQQMGGTLQTIAKDVKLQVEFNPAQVGAYRLLGYEDRALAAQDFNDDRKDAGDIGAGHGVTALYEIVPAGLVGSFGVDQLKYQSTPPAPRPELVASDELLNVKLRWKEPSGDTSRKIELPVHDAGGTLAQAPADLRFAAAVAGFGMKLRGSDHAKDLSWTMVAALADSARGSDLDGWRAEFVRLAKIAAGLQGEPVPADLDRNQFPLGYTSPPRR